MINRQRVEVLFSVAENDKVKIKAFLADALSHHFGGLTFSEVEGVWRDDGNDFKDFYSGELVTEITLCIMISIQPDQTALCIELVKKYMIELAKHFNGFSAVHLETYTTQEFHFTL